MLKLISLISIAALLFAQPVLAQQSTDSEDDPVEPVTTPLEASTPATKQQMDHKFEKAEKYYAECPTGSVEEFKAIKTYLQAFTDAEVMAETMADPVKFFELMTIVNDPRTIHVMMKCASEPVMWDTWVRGMSDFNKLSRASMHFMNPAMYMKWMMAPMNPQTYAPMMQMMSPDYYTRWMTAMMNPTFYQPMFALADPNWYTPRIQWMMNPQSFQPMFNMFSAAEK